ncbi:MarC family protein [Corynebacterium argentoratense]|uniref:MarC family protein n=1 Tax=Corynebacterium argentoratense TaxID=42817 RepID=UPI001F1B1C85|nr:MarC family protein [Corynebacterium argentoratense]MCF1764665.1 NAAT family transporter [Corynebacterium argentoratense]
MIHLLVTTIAALFPITNPIGAVAVYASMSARMSERERNKQAILTAIYVFAILAVFAIAGPMLLKGLGLTIPALQIAGGLVVGHSGYAMLGAKQQLSDAEHKHAGTKVEAQQDIAFTPMALPMIAGPGAIGVVIALGAKHTFGIETAGMVIGIAVMALIIGLCLTFGTEAIQKMGPTGVGALSRIMGFLILAIGVQLIIAGATTQLPH